MLIYSPGNPLPGLNVAKTHMCKVMWSGVDRENKSSSVEIFNIWTATPDRMVTEHYSN
jgi:hypothetical protein